MSSLKVRWGISGSTPALMRRHEVSSRVNLAKNDDPACAEPG